MTYQFLEAEILVQPESDDLGPFAFDLGPQLPSGDHVADVEVKSYRHSEETTSVLIDGATPVASDVVSVKFKWPGAAYAGKHKLTFIYTTDAGMDDEADFWCVLVEDV